MRKRYFSIPIKIHNIIENIEATKIQRDRMYKIVYLILDDYAREKRIYDEWREYPVAYWKKAIAEHYENALGPLVWSNVVQRDDSYWSGPDPKCKTYRVNPSLLLGDKVKIGFAFQKAPNQKQDFVTKATKQILRKLSVDRRAALAFLQDYLNEGTIASKLKVDEQITEEGSIGVLYRQEDKGKYQQIYTPKEIAIAYAHQRNQSLIQDGRKFKIANRQVYIARKRVSIEFSYRQCLDKFYHRDYYANRNETNYRLDSNLTTFPGVLLPYLRLDKEPLAILDLKNSQFLFLAHLIEQGVFDAQLHNVEKIFADQNKTLLQEKIPQNVRSLLLGFEGERKVSSGGFTPGNQRDRRSYIKREREAYMCAELGLKVRTKNSEKPKIIGDIRQFVEFAKNGALYEHIQSELDLPTGPEGRKMAKQMLFEIFFSKYNNNSSAKSRVKAIFPRLINMIDTYKKQKREENRAQLVEQGKEDDKKGDNQFAILLQRAESKLFVDCILHRLLNAGFMVLSKHDSIICRKSDLAGVKGVMKEELDQAFGVDSYELNEELYPISLKI